MGRGLAGVTSRRRASDGLTGSFCRGLRPSGGLNRPISARYSVGFSLRASPFVRLAEWAGSQYTARNAFLQEVFSLATRRTAPTATSPQFSESRKPRLSIDDFRNKGRYGGDGNRIDLAYAVYALAHGDSEDEIRSALASRDLSKKGPAPRQRAYVERTIRKACSTLSR